MKKEPVVKTGSVTEYIFTQGDTILLSRSIRKNIRPVPASSLRLYRVGYGGDGVEHAA